MSARGKARKRALDILFEAEIRSEPVLDLLGEPAGVGLRGRACPRRACAPGGDRRAARGELAGLDAGADARRRQEHPADRRLRAVLRRWRAGRRRDQRGRAARPRAVHRRVACVRERVARAPAGAQADGRRIRDPGAAKPAGPSVVPATFGNAYRRREEAPVTGERTRGTRDDTGCHILHVDMDAFYASVEVRDRPELAGAPVIVGSPAGRSVVLSATYPARAFGVRSAMPMARARRLCPQAVIIPPRRGLYASVSREVMAIFRAVTPEVEPLALDEACVDGSGALRRLGPPAFIAKLASIQCKPDGLLVIPADGVLEFLHPLPVSALWGVGERTGRVLAGLGLRTVADIAHAPQAALERGLGRAAGAHLAALAWGRDDRRVVPGMAEKSIGAEETFDVDVDDPDVLRRELLRLSGRTARSLRASGCAARTIVEGLLGTD